MANTNSTQHAATAPQGGSGYGVQVAWGTREVAANPSAADTVTFFEIPEGATVIAGWLMGDDLDTGAETIECDVGDASDTDRFLNSGVLTGDVITDWKPEVGIYMPLFGTLKDGPYTYTSATDIIGTFVATAATGGTGTLTLVMLYTFNDPRVSPPDAPV